MGGTGRDSGRAREVSADQQNHSNKDKLCDLLPPCFPLPAAAALAFPSPPSVPVCVCFVPDETDDVERELVDELLRGQMRVSNTVHVLAVPQRVHQRPVAVRSLDGRLRDGRRLAGDGDVDGAGGDGGLEQGAARARVG